TLVPWAWLLTRTADCRIFLDDARAKWSVPKIVLQIFRDNAQSAFKDSLSGTYQSLEYTVQYGESSLAFVNRLMEREGIYYFFDHEEDVHTLVMADDASAHEPYPGYETLTYRTRDRVHA